MMFHLAAAFTFWAVGLFYPSLSETLLISVMVAGFIAFILFIRDCLNQLNEKFICEAIEAEGKSHADLSSFKGRFVAVRDGYSPFPDDFTYVIFTDGHIEIPLFCRKRSLIEKASNLGADMIVYYKDYILVDIAEIEEQKRVPASF